MKAARRQDRRWKLKSITVERTVPCLDLMSQENFVRD